MPEIIVKLGDNVVQKYFFVKEPMSIGRGAENEIVIENLAISRNHATIKCEDGHYILADLGSSNGTYVNGVKVKRTELMDKDVVTLGKHKLFFYDQRASEPARHAPMPEDRTMMVTATMIGQLAVTKGRQKGQVFILDQPAITLGKGSECQLQLNDWFVSKQHAVIEKRKDDYIIRDLNSWRHTRVNGEVVREAMLMNGDVLQLGPTVTLSFSLESSFREVDNRAAQAVVARAGTLRAEDDPAPQEAPLNGSAADHSVPDVSTAKVQRDDEGAKKNPALVIEDMAACSVAAAADAAEDVLKADERAQENAQAEALALAAQGSADQAGGMPETASESADEANFSAAMASGQAEPPASDIDPAKAEEIKLWERALQNPSQVIRKQAARRLKALTGKDYEY